MKLYRIAVGVVGALMLSTAVYAGCVGCVDMCQAYCDQAYADAPGERDACANGCVMGCGIACIE